MKINKNLNINNIIIDYKKKKKIFIIKYRIKSLKEFKYIFTLFITLPKILKLTSIFKKEIYSNFLLNYISIIRFLSFFGIIFIINY
jgi:hypothetical protein